MTKLRVLSIANFFAALFFFYCLFNTEGGRFVACFALIIFHIIMGFGLLKRANWARALMIVYGTFQIFAVLTASVVSILSLQYKPISSWTMLILFLLFTMGPFLAWAIFFLINPKTKSLFSVKD